MFSANSRHQRTVPIVLPALCLLGALLSLVPVGHAAAARPGRPEASAPAQAYRKFFMHVRLSKCMQDRGVDTADIESFVESVLTGEQMTSRFAQRGLKYENKRYYFDAADSDYTDLNNYPEFHAEHLAHILRNNDYQLAFFVLLSCLPKTEKSPYRLIIRSIDRDQISNLLKRGKNVRDLHYNTGSSSVEAVDTDRSDLTDLSDDLVNALYRGFFKLLHVPNIEPVSDIRTYDPGSKVEQFFQLRTNLDPSLDSAAAQGQIDKFRIQYAVFEVSGDQIQSICSAPDANLALLDCATQTARDSGQCSSSDLERFQVQRLHTDTVRPQIEKNPKTGSLRGGVRVVFDTASFSTVYLIRAVATVPGASGETELESRPAYRCVQTRPRPLRAGLMVRLGFPFDINNTAADGPLPPAGLNSAMAVDLNLTFYLSGRRSKWFSSAYLGPAIGYAWLGGVYPCPNRNSLNCQDPLRVRYQTLSNAWSGHLSAMFQAEVFQHGRFALRTISSFGIGIESLRSTIKPFRNDGFHLLALVDVGLAVAMENIFRTKVASNMMLGLLFETRLRMEKTTVEAMTSFLRTEAAGVPDSLYTIWLIYAAEFGRPHDQRNPWTIAGH